MFESSRRELMWVLAMGLVFGIWVLGISWTLGHGPEGEDGPRLILGLPSWVFWGVALPWAAATAFSIAFALFGISDCALETVEGEEMAEDRGRRPRTDAGDEAEGRKR